MEWLATASAADLHAPVQRELTAGLLIADLAGFTAMTERLQAQDREGAERVSELVDLAYRPMIEAIATVGGSVVSFIGDAVLALFDGEQPVTRASRAADSIRKAFSLGLPADSSVAPERLEVSQSIHFGRCASMIVGREVDGSSTELHHVLAGPAVVRLERLLHRAGDGGVMLSRAARQRLLAEAGTATGAHVRNSLPTLPAERLLPFFSPGIRELLHDFRGQHRRAVVLLVETRGWDLDEVQAHFLAITAAMDRYDGLLLKSNASGNGTLWICLLGVPRAHEDDGERAVRAALETIDAVPRRERMRGALASGLLVNIELGTPERRAIDVLGDVVNTAARAVARAPWGEIVVPEALRARVPGLRTRSGGTHRLKGKSHSLELHLLRSVIEADSRAPSQSTSFVGRQEERARLRSILETAAAGRGATLHISGEPGVGKTRLGEVIAAEARELGFETHSGVAGPYGREPYRALASLLGDCAGLHAGATARQVLEAFRLEGEALGLGRGRDAHLADVLGKRAEDSSLVHLQGGALRTANALAARLYLAARCDRAPQLYVLDDLHLVDELSMEVIDELVGEASELGLVMLLLARQGFTAPETAAHLDLARMSSADTIELAATILECAREQLAANEELSAFLHERSGGNPLVLEQVLRHLGETGALLVTEGVPALTSAADRDAFPADLETIVGARLDRLPAAPQRVAEVSAVVGRRVLTPVLQHVSEVRETAATGLESLLEHHILISSPTASELEVSFDSSLTRDVAYGRILMRRRRTLHRDVAAALVELREDPAVAASELSGDRILAEHLRAAGDDARARQHFALAARAAAARFAHEEAERLYRAAIELAADQVLECAALRVEMCEHALKMSGDYSGGVLELKRALSECGSEPTVVRADALGRLGDFLRILGETDRARERLEESREIGRLLGDRTVQARAISLLALLATERGEIEVSHGLYDEAQELHGILGDRLSEAKVLGGKANLLMAERRLDEARELIVRALEIFRELGDRRAEGTALGNLGVVSKLGGDLDEAERCYLAALEIHHEVGDRQLQGVVLGNLGNVASMRDDEAMALARHASAIAQFRDVGDLLNTALSLGNIAECHARAGRHEAAAELCASSSKLFERVGNRARQAGAFLSRADSLLALDRPADALLEARRAAEIFAEIEAPADAVEARLVCAAACRARGDRPGAARDLAIASALLARVQGDRAGQLSRELAAEIER